MPTIAADPFAGENNDGFLELSKGVFSITKSDTDEMTHIARGVYCNTTAGNVAIVFEDGSELTIAIAVGENTLTKIPARIRQVKSTGTTAAGLFGIK